MLLPYQPPQDKVAARDFKDCRLLRRLALCLSLLAPAAHAADLTVTVEGLRNDKGKLSLGLYGDKDDWPDGKPSYNEGYIFDGSGALKPARVIKVPWLAKLAPSGDDVSFVLETAEGKVSVRGETFANTRSRSHADLPADFPIVQQSHVRYRWDNEETVGMLERSTPASKVTR